MIESFNGERELTTFWTDCREVSVNFVASSAENIATVLDKIRPKLGSTLHEGFFISYFVGSIIVSLWYEEKIRARMETIKVLNVENDWKNDNSSAAGFHVSSAHGRHIYRIPAHDVAARRYDCAVPLFFINVHHGNWTTSISITIQNAISFDSTSVFSQFDWILFIEFIVFQYF